ncbi:MAG: hypothetical protein OXT67_03815 [Zetaproteobacteria bacterium]|nr:hypothetical protein [Zetaproteobacteria bacterium]
MKYVWMLVIFFSGCYKHMTAEEWKARCMSHPYYTYYTAYEAGKSQRDIGGKIGGNYDDDNNRCSPTSTVQLWNSSDPDAQYTLQALKEMTGATTLMGLKAKITELEVLDFRPYPEIRDLRPLMSRNHEVTKIIRLPEGAQIHSLWALQSELEVLDAPGVTVTGTRPEDCPTEELIVMNRAAPPAFYPQSVIEFCKQLGR